MGLYKHRETPCQRWLASRLQCMLPVLGLLAVGRKLQQQDGAPSLRGPKHLLYDPAPSVALDQQP